LNPKRRAAKKKPDKGFIGPYVFVKRGKNPHEEK
jgi:hypothetical protein